MDHSETAVSGAFGLAWAATYAFITSNDKGRITFANEAAAVLFGYSVDELMGANIDLIVPERFRASHEAGMARMARNEPSRLSGRTIEVMARRRDGGEFPAEFTLSMWRDRSGLCFGAILRDISEWRARDERLVQLAHHDLLTGLPNRACFEEALDAKLAAGDAIGVLMLDLDGFKEVNDSWGHSTGDAVLQTLAIRLPAWLGENAVFARFGGDEFAVILPDAGDPATLAASATTLLDAFAAPLQVGCHTFHLGVSIGGAIGPKQGASAEELIGNADLAMFRAKQEGKRRFRFFQPAMRSALLSRLAMRAELHEATQQGEFVLHYQPQVALDTGRIIGAEALLRWQHPRRGLLLPGVFLSHLEDHPLALEVGHWVVEEACRQAVAWRAAGHPAMTMGVNLSAAQVRAGTLASDVADALRRHQLSPGMLELEITETIVLSVDEADLDQFRVLHRQGVGIAFDDFGTGYASLSSLKRFPLTRLKIDRGFVRDLMAERHDAAVVRAIVQIGNDIGLNVIAEGIETKDQEARLLEMGCRHGQGYLYGKALPAARFADLVEASRSLERLAG
ncbi:putative bifunctional diguanylate cyclase/phosphodiesterase [Methylobacterium sp. PvR107]|uniref:putative bifunctional diguanylate cyclase/phosphodiesterase n=1 Tax=Methylobacterium sp. PvR107 TaxID=2806597 RepID=UPI001B494FBD|nr:EAL domain-containing protein [Methylobacterium sp. PvR107]MBP1179331.1 diguanylate cyclase (GGDEF)-like protein/PAS domain S-box-containing protein [Methylobacterium sp. PvR107]